MAACVFGADVCTAAILLSTYLNILWISRCTHCIDLDVVVVRKSKFVVCIIGSVCPLPAFSPSVHRRCVVILGTSMATRIEELQQQLEQIQKQMVLREVELAELKERQKTALVGFNMFSIGFYCNE